MAEQTGRTKLFIFSASPSSIDSMPHVISNEGCIEAAHPYRSGNKFNNKLLVSKNSIIDNSIYSVLDPSIGESALLFSTLNNGVTFSLHASQVSEIWFCNVKNYNVHTWVMKPFNFDACKTYLLVYVIHSGLQTV